jgi:hypothetical protein
MIPISFLNDAVSQKQKTRLVGRVSSRSWVFRPAYASQAVADRPIGDKRGWLGAPK